MLSASVFRCCVTKSTGINLGQVTRPWIWVCRFSSCQVSSVCDGLVSRVRVSIPGSHPLTLTGKSWMLPVDCCPLTRPSSVPAPQEIGPLGHRGSAGSVSGGPDHRPDLRHPHGQRARRWILPRHHRKSSTSGSSSTLSCCFTKAFSGISVLAAEFRSVPGHRWHPPGGKPPLHGEFSKPAF